MQAHPARTALTRVTPMPDVAQDSTSMSLIAYEWIQSISDAGGFSLMGYFAFKASARNEVELSNGTNLYDAPFSLGFMDEPPNIERGIGTIELVDVEPEGIAGNISLYVQKPYYDELWKQVREGRYAECELRVRVAPVVWRGTRNIWNVSERQSLFV